MERDLPVPETGATQIDSLLVEAHRAGTAPDRLSSQSVHWVRLAALALGLTCLSGGIGMIPGFYFLSDPEALGMWPLGLIPIFIGLGLLLFVRLSRGMAEKLNGN